MNFAISAMYRNHPLFWRFINYMNDKYKPFWEGNAEDSYFYGVNKTYAFCSEDLTEDTKIITLEEWQASLNLSPEIY